ncbi:hypothetical protein ACXYMO_17325 [Arenibacterium sp. CAU 1754]
MTRKSRFIKSVVETTRKGETEMPWSRGARRAQMIARRSTDNSSSRQARLG